MKYLMMALIVMLAAMFFVLEVSKTYATAIEIHQITFEDQEGNVVYQAYFAGGASLQDFELPVAPDKVGFEFVGWSGLLPDEMPYADLIYEPVYVQKTLSFNFNI